MSKVHGIQLSNPIKNLINWDLAGQANVSGTNRIAEIQLQTGFDMIIKKMFIVSRVSHHDINKNTLQSQNNAKLADGLDTECKLDASKQLDAYNLSNEKHKSELSSQGRVSWFLQCAAIHNHEMCQCNWVYTGEMSDLLCTPSTRTTHFQPKMSHCSEQTAVEVWQPVSPNGTDDDNNNGEEKQNKTKTDFFF